MADGIGLATRGRTVSDMMSGLEISRNDSHAVYQDFTQDELESQFARFKQYDLDDTGFITPENLLIILEAIGMEGATLQHCHNMVEEVSILTGHANDGKLSFRDYCAVLAYEKDKAALNTIAEAQEELRLSQADPTDEADQVPDLASDGAGDTRALDAGTRRRGSSFAVLDQLAVSRIARFEQTIHDAAVAAGRSTPDQIAEMSRQRKFADRLAKFKQVESGTPLARVNEEAMHKQSLKAKLAAFEEAAKKEPLAFKTSWKNVRQGTWKQKTSIAGGIAPPKKLSDLP